VIIGETIIFCTEKVVSKFEKLNFKLIVFLQNSAILRCELNCELKHEITQI